MSFEFDEMRRRHAQWLAKDAFISEAEALQIIDDVGFEPGLLRREARLFKYAQRANW